MYNCYLPQTQQPEITNDLSRTSETDHPSIFQRLGAQIRSVQLDGDLCIALLVVLFLLSDGEFAETDLLIILAVLLLLGF